jgi:hypothetical protein
MEQGKEGGAAEVTAGAGIAELAGVFGTNRLSSGNSRNCSTSDAGFNSVLGLKVVARAGTVVTERHARAHKTRR